MKLQKIEIDLKFNKKRDYKLVTPCCNRSNKDGKFINYFGLDKQYGYCHSCGKSSLPPTLHKDDNGNLYIWDDVKNEFASYGGNDIQNSFSTLKRKDIEIKHIHPSIVEDSVLYRPENNLIKYLRNNYGNDETDKIINMYHIGSDKNGWTLFWNIDKELMVRKVKAIDYSTSGKRTSKIRSPYLNEHGYKACLFGEHLLNLGNKDKDIYVLVESEKTAIICSIIMPKYRWLAYGGINGLTKDKIQVLNGFRVLIIPDMSKNAVRIIKEMIPMMRETGIHANIWDLTYGKTDKQLKKDNEYNNDLEDILKKQKHEN